jgi:hypothetical protein
MGATVTAIDAVDKNIKIASIHAVCTNFWACKLLVECIYVCLSSEYYYLKCNNQQLQYSSSQWFLVIMFSGIWSDNCFHWVLLHNSWSISFSKLDYLLSECILYVRSLHCSVLTAFTYCISVEQWRGAAVLTLAVLFH